MSLLLHAIDAFGSKFSFTIKEKRTLTTAFGGLLTILSVFAIIIIFMVLGNDFISQKNPKVAYVKYINKEPQKINFNGKNITIAFNIQKDFPNDIIDLQGGFLWAEFNQLSPEEENRAPLTEPFFEEIPIIKCNELPYQTTQIFSNDFYCLNLSEKSFIGGIKTNYEYSLQMTIRFCEKNSLYGFLRHNCRGVDELQRKFKQNNNYPYFVNLYYPVLYYDSRNNNNPATIEYHSKKFPFDHNLQRTDNLFLHSSVIDDDSGWWFEDHQRKGFWTVESTFVSYQYKSNEDLNQSNSSSQLYKLTISLNPTTQHYQRNYIKVQDILAISITLSRFVIVIFQFITMLINGVLIKFHVFNQMFDWSSVHHNTSSSGTNGNHNVSNSIQGLMINKDRKTNLFGYPIKIKEVIEPYRNSIKKNEDINKYKNRITKCFAIKRRISKEIICGSQKKIINLYDNGMKIIKETMDLDYYIKIIFDVILIKKKNLVDSKLTSGFQKNKLNLFDVNGINSFFHNKSSDNCKIITNSTIAAYSNQNANKDPQFVFKKSDSILSFKNKRK